MSSSPIEEESTTDSEQEDSPPMTEMQFLLGAINLGLQNLAEHMTQQMNQMHQQQREFITTEIKKSEDKILIVLAQYFDSLAKDYSTDLKATKELHAFYNTLLKLMMGVGPSPPEVCF